MTCGAPLCIEYALGLAVWGLVLGFIFAGALLLYEGYRASRKDLRD